MRFTASVRATICFLSALILCAACDKKLPGADKKMLVIGFDGMEPRLVRKLMEEGRMPNLARLAKEGGFTTLATSIPPQSPVAWATFISGADAGVHGIFDFVHRKLPDPTAMYFSTSEVRPGAEPFEYNGYLIPKPWSPPENILLRDGRPFWDFLETAGVPIQMYYLPADYPPSKSSHGKMCCLAGMGVPDALATQGTYQYFSHDSDVPYGGDTSGGGRRMRLMFNKEDILTARLVGPQNPFRVNTPETTLELQVFPDAENEVAKIEWTNKALLGDESVELILKTGEWSGWQPVVFETAPLMQPGGIRAMVKLFLKQVHPEVRLYVSPINFDPRAPQIVFTEPPTLATRIADDVGAYGTVGFREAFKALQHQVLNDEEYRTQALSVFDETQRTLDHALREYRGGVLFFYFSTSDLVSHMFWWEGDGKHPVRSVQDAKKYNAVVAEFYDRLDNALGRAMNAVGDDATVLVLSDHGFNNWSRKVNLNNWLRDEGYLVPQNSATAWPGLTQNTDWSRTRAYGLGLNGLYLNLKGREKDGIVSPGPSRDSLLEEIRSKLLALKDPLDGKSVVTRVYRADEVYHGPRVADAPDLIVGYSAGYRVSGESGQGNFESQTISDNTEAWSADHCVAADLVPGILVSNRKIVRKDPALVDLAPTILSEYGVPIPAQMTGHGLLESQP